jgi:hypothetical protein
VEETNEPDQVSSRSKLKTWDTTIDRVPSWPEEARPLKKHTWISYVYGIGDFILVLLPLFFIRKYYKKTIVYRSKLELVLGIAVVALNGKPTEDSAFGQKVEFVMQLVSHMSR